MEEGALYAGFLQDQGCFFDRPFPLGQRITQLFDDLRVLVGDVDLLQRIGSEVKELDALALPGQDQAVRSPCDGSTRALKRRLAEGEERIGVESP